MDITKSDLDAVRRVLSGKISREKAAIKYSNRHRIMVAVAVLQGAGVTEKDLAEPRGIYGELLFELSVQPAIPATGWPRDKQNRIKIPTWYRDSDVRQEYLVDGSRRYEFHNSRDRAGHGIRFIGCKHFDTLLDEDASRRAMCRKWYEDARRGVIERQAEIRAYQKANEALRTGFVKIVEQYSSTFEHPDFVMRPTVEEIAKELNELLRRTNPKS